MFYFFKLRLLKFSKNCYTVYRWFKMITVVAALINKNLDIELMLTFCGVIFMHYLITEKERQL